MTISNMFHGVTEKIVSVIAHV